MVGGLRKGALLPLGQCKHERYGQTLHGLGVQEVPLPLPLPPKVPHLMVTGTMSSTSDWHSLNDAQHFDNHHHDTTCTPHSLAPFHCVQRSREDDWHMQAGMLRPEWFSIFRWHIWRSRYDSHASIMSEYPLGKPQRCYAL